MEPQARAHESPGLSLPGFNYRDLLRYNRKRTLTFSEFIQEFLRNPQNFLQTSSSLITSSVKHFGFRIMIRSGEPVLSYNVFEDPFSNGINAVFGQEFCIKQVMDIIESADKEVGPNRGVILFGPPASGKTNIVDLLIRAVEEYTKQVDLRLYSFFFQFKSDSGRSVELRSEFRHSPILLFPTILRRQDGTLSRPRQELFDHVNHQRPESERVTIPTFFQGATLDKRTLDILEGLLNNPRNREKSLFDLLEEYVFVEEIEFSGAQAKGISNIDDMNQLRVRTRPLELGPEDVAVISEHVPGKAMYSYEGATIWANRGILHIHDAFGGNGENVRESEYKPLLMLLGSGRVSLESTQTALDTSVVMTTNIEEMEMLDRQLTSSKLLDRIEKVPVNYLLDASSEMDILRRDMANIRDRYELDPNLFRIAAFFSVVTRLLPPMRRKFPPQWSPEKIDLYLSITPEQKLMIYSSLNEDPVTTIQKLPHWHPFRNEAMRVGLDLSRPEHFAHCIIRHPDAVSLRGCGRFDEEELKLVDDEFMRFLMEEHYPNEGRHGISIRQLQNVMRNTVANSDGRKVHVGIFLSQLKKVMAEGSELHHWLEMDAHYHTKRRPLPERTLEGMKLEEGEGDYGNFHGLVRVVKALYHGIIRKEITVCTVDRDPLQIEQDLRRYLQHALLDRALRNKAFAHVMVPRFSFIDPRSGEKVEEPDERYLNSIEQVLAAQQDTNRFRQEMAQKFLDFQANGELQIEDGKSILASRQDNLLKCFTKEYSRMLSHRKLDEDINPEHLRNAFFHKLNDPAAYERADPSVRAFTERILANMCQRYGYPESIALTTVVFALRKDVVDFRKILS